MLAELLAMRDADTLSASALPEGLDAWVKHVEEQASPLLAPKGVRKETDRLACWLHGKNVSVSSKGGRLTWNETTTRLKGREGAGGRQASMSSAKSKNRKSQQRPEETRWMQQELTLAQVWTMSRQIKTPHRRLLGSLLWR